VITQQRSIFDIERPAKRIKKQDMPLPHACPLYEVVMQLGNSYRYRQLAVNGSLLIGRGPDGWHAYAIHATSGRVEEIKRAIRATTQGGK
jgi:hypothetical protein